MSTSGSYHHGQLRDVLLRSAGEALESVGIEGLSLRALAQSAGVSPMAPYRHFEDKALLLAALAEAGFIDLRSRLEEADKAPAREAIINFGVAYVRFAMEKPGLFRLMYGGSPPTPESGQADNTATALGLVRTRIGEIVSPDQLEDALIAGWALVHGLAMLMSSGRLRAVQNDPDALVARVSGVLLAGLAL